MARSSAADKGWKSLRVRILSKTCSKLLIPEFIVMTPSLEPTQRKAHEARLASDRCCFKMASAAGDRLARLPPLTGSMTKIGTSFSRHLRYRSPACRLPDGASPASFQSA